MPRKTKSCQSPRNKAHFRKSRLTAMIAVEVVQSFVYLDSEIDMNGSCAVVSRLECTTRVHFVQVSVSVSRPGPSGLET